MQSITRCTIALLITAFQKINSIVLNVHNAYRYLLSSEMLKWGESAGDPKSQEVKEMFFRSDHILNL